ncbi:hypothetical protein [Hymenobacter gummosus]|uniref:hypothetical protein n=1 Tax=Hymenobacter gummosus TaxID=1776032 RepID=UPI001A9D90B8|nr:hypothetical protein [Hymenobacter gummosus]
MAKKPVKKKQQDPEKKPKVHKELEGFEIKVNPLGEITSTYSIEQINEFLNRHVRDKKLVNRDGQFGEKTAAEDDEDFPVEDGQAEEPEESDEDFMRRSSREAKKPKKADEEPTAADSDEE